MANGTPPLPFSVLLRDLPHACPFLRNGRSRCHSMGFQLHHVQGEWARAKDPVRIERVANESISSCCLFFTLLLTDYALSHCGNASRWHFLPFRSHQVSLGLSQRGEAVLQPYKLPATFSAISPAFSRPLSASGSRKLVDFPLSSE